MSSVLLGASPPRADAPPPPAAPPAFPPGAAPAGGAGDHPQRNNTLTVIAGVGVLLLAMGVGVLIGRSGATRQSAAPTPVITVSSPSSSPASTPAATEASFAGDWPSGTSGYTVQLQTLPQSGTALSAVESARSAAGAKGAKAVGALKSEGFTSLTSGSYVIYSGVYHTNGEAQKALAGLRKSFPSAKVIEVSNGGSSSSTPKSGSSGGSSSSSGNGHPAAVSSPALKSVKGKTYEEKSKNVPNQVEF
jgi:hypothetical protein